VPKHSPSHKLLGNNLPYFTEWDNNPPHKQTIYVMRSAYDRALYDVIIDMPLKAFTKAYSKWVQGEHIQVAFDKLPPEIREFIKTGITPSQWNEMFKPEPQDGEE
jgi:hypothetical protein